MLRLRRRIGAETPPRSTSLRVLLASTLILIVLAVTALVVGNNGSESKAEIAARTKPPGLSTLTAKVEIATLNSRIVTRGTVRAAATIDVGCFPTSSTEGATSSPIFTQPTPAIGTLLKEGDVLAQVNGRPLFVLQGEHPSFRELAPGSEGSDIAQLQASLKRLGFLKVTESSFGPSTQAAVRSLYRSKGQNAFEPTNEEANAVRQGQRAVDQATRNLSQARSDYEAAGQPPGETEVLQARAAVLEAELALRAAEQTGSMGAETSQSIASPSDDSPADPESQAILIETARIRLRIAQSALEALTGARDRSAHERALREAQTLLADAQSELLALNKRIGLRVPFCEVIFVPGPTATLTRSSSTLGSQSDSSAAGSESSAWAQLSSGDLVVIAEVSESEGRLLTEGMETEFDQDSAVTAGKIESIDLTPTLGKDASGYVVRIRPEVPLGPDQIGKNFRITISVASTDGSSLVVPLSAVVAAADGTAFVTKITENGNERVKVKAGLSGDGRVAVTVENESLKPGDPVRVGR
jgi:HlyD family secretion protein